MRRVYPDLETVGLLCRLSAVYVIAVKIHEKHSLRSLRGASTGTPCDAVVSMRYKYTCVIWRLPRLQHSNPTSTSAFIYMWLSAFASECRFFNSPVQTCRPLKSSLFQTKRGRFWLDWKIYIWAAALLIPSPISVAGSISVTSLVEIWCFCGVRCNLDAPICRFYFNEPSANNNQLSLSCWPVLTTQKICAPQDGQSRTIRQFQFTDWPEQGVPKTGEGFIDFIGQVHKTKEQFGQDGPITVHCR